MSLGPIPFVLPDAWDSLRTELEQVDDTPAFLDVLRIVEQQVATLALLEPDYIDVDFRDEYQHYYSSKFRPLPNRCRRLHFFRREGDADRYLGFLIIRPIAARPVCRTIIAPPPTVEPYVACQTTSRVRPYGQSLSVSGFPFMEQDAQFGVCAHASVWMVALYHHLEHRTPRRLISDIAKAALSRPEVFRVTPSEGLSAEQVAAALTGIGLPAIPYAIDRLPRGERLDQIVARYLNSRLPVILTTSTHVTVLIGYGRDVDNRLFFVRSDESRGPYRRVYAADDPLGEWNFLFVPTPGRIYLSGEAAESAARVIFRGWLRGEHARLQPRTGMALRLRSYVTQSGDYKARMLERGMPEDVFAAHRFVGASHWVWVVELQDPALARRSRRCVIGEVVFDATSDPLRPEPLFGNLPTRSYSWPEPRGRPVEFATSDYEPYLSGTAIHDAPTAPVAQRNLRLRVRSRVRRAKLRARRTRPLR